MSLPVPHMLGSTARGGFEIYVDPTEDPEMGDVVMAKKRKLHAALDGLAWGGGDALREATNMPKLNGEEGKIKVKTREEKDLGGLKVKGETEGRWWSIRRGRKDSKDKTKENKVLKAFNSDEAKSSI
ncbi:hypothetical protein BDQ17DRAFT_1434495 [Cyathus striatus]|nr:hypothetical protein BDQ17DRAFT_1434495 [Cyathus striatus]